MKNTRNEVKVSRYVTCSNKSSWEKIPESSNRKLKGLSLLNPHEILS